MDINWFVDIYDAIEKYRENYYEALSKTPPPSRFRFTVKPLGRYTSYQFSSPHLNFIYSGNGSVVPGKLMIDEFTTIFFYGGVPRVRVPVYLFPHLIPLPKFLELAKKELQGWLSSLPTQLYLLYTNKLQFPDTDLSEESIGEFNLVFYPRGSEERSCKFDSGYIVVPLFPFDLYVSRKRNPSQNEISY